MNKKFLFTDDLSTYERTVLCASEFLGTAILVIIGCMGCVTSISSESVAFLQIALCFGIAVMVAIQCVGHISGAHINPAVSVAAALLGHLALIELPVYFVGQFFGAIAGFGVIKAVTPGKFLDVTNGTARITGVCSPGISPKITTLQGLLVEFLATLILILVCCAVWDPRNNTKHDSVAIRFGLTVAALAMATGAYTGTHMNPARSFAPALWNGDWGDHWVYWVAPFLAAIVGAVGYRLLFALPKPSEEKNNIAETIPLNDHNKA